jgi:hypothetical protein
MDPNALATLGLALASFTLAEASIAVVGIIAVAEAPAIFSGIATSLAVGGFAGGVAVVALVGLIGIGLVGVVVGTFAVAAAAQAVAAQLAAANAPTPKGVGQSGEQTDFNFEPPPPPPVVRFSSDPLGPLIGIVTDSSGITQVTELSVPSFETSQSLDLSPLPDPGVPDVSFPDVPGLPDTPGFPDVGLPDAPGLPGEVGLFSVAEPPLAGPLADSVPWPSSLLLLLLGILATARRIVR